MPRPSVPADPRRGCVYMKYPRFWRDKKNSSAPVKPEPAAPVKTFCYSPRGDSDAFVKFFAGVKPRGS